MGGMDEMNKFGKFCPICRLPISPMGMLTSCPTHGELIFLDAAMGQEGDVQCTGCGKMVHKRYFFCPHCGIRLDR